jgi:hypothetical protein
MPQATTPLKEDLSTRYWNVNLPKERWTEHCPDYLVGQSEKNIRILSTKNEDFKRLSWPEVQELVRTNRIDLFERSALQLRRYKEFTHQLKTTYGSVLSFIQRKRLFWNDTTPSGDRPFTNPADFTILYNDWPYLVEQDVKHLVVWTKFPIDDDEAAGDDAEEAKAMIEEFITTKFCLGDNGSTRKMRRNQIVWFKNWKSLKSVHELEHFHIMLYKAPADLLEAVTGGDRPKCETWTGKLMQ